jgi:AmmeMemoRadiSam system protein A
VLAQAGATFVTLTINDELRGCFASLEAVRPLGEDVAQNAVAAAFRDPRFSAMSAAEWPQCRVEVSLLSTPKPVRFADEADLVSQLEVGKDGVIVEADGKRGTFLPQVWEDLQDKRAFLAHLVRKAGLPADTRITRCKVSRYRVLKWKE